ncbi:hypothetical protein Tco_1490996 [Tanacetum coccineum]
MYHFQTTHLVVVLSCLVQCYYEVMLPDPYSAVTHFGGVTDRYQSVINRALWSRPWFSRGSLSAHLMGLRMATWLSDRQQTFCLGKPVMSSDSVVTYTSVHSETRSWSIPSEDPYEEAARQLLEQAPRPSEYVPDPIELEDHVPVYIPEPEHPEDLVPAEDKAPIEAYIIEVAFAPTPPLPPPSFLPTLIRPPHNRAAMA